VSIELAHHEGHMAHICYLGYNNEIRSRNNFISPNPSMLTVGMGKNYNKVINTMCKTADEEV
jgi:hypothetical protein